MSWVLMGFGRGYVARPENPDSYTNNLEEAMEFATKQEAFAARRAGEILVDKDKIVKKVES